MRDVVFDEETARLAPAKSGQPVELASLNRSIIHAQVMQIILAQFTKLRTRKTDGYHGSRSAPDACLFETEVADELGDNFLGLRLAIRSKVVSLRRQTWPTYRDTEVNGTTVGPKPLLNLASDDSTGAPPKLKVVSPSCRS